MTKEELDKWVENSHYYEHDECVVLLRQLQAEIENLKRINHHEHIVAENALKEIEELKVEIVAIEKNTDYWADKGNWIKNNKPVAWTNEKNLNNIQVGGAGYIWKLLAEKTDIPLYTHPVELTDEEKKKIAKQLWLFGWVDSSQQGICLLDEIETLRKAQEK